MTAITSHVPLVHSLTVPFAAAGTPAYSQIIFNVTGEQARHFKDHIRLVIIAIHKLKSITILRTWFRCDDVFEQSFIIAVGDPHKIILAEIANSLHLAQFQLCNLILPKEYF